MSEALARIHGIPTIPSITHVNVRRDASIQNELLFRVPVGMSGQRILEVKPDITRANRDGKQFEWFKLLFDGGAVGWVRDDLIQIEGDCRHFGYPNLSEPILAFDLKRHAAVPPDPEVSTDKVAINPDDATPQDPTVEKWIPPQPTLEPLLTPVLASGDFPDALQDQERVQTIAYRLTATWEGDFDAINTFDEGIISYGFLQFTLAGGALIDVLTRYLEKSNSPTADQLQTFMAKVNARDESLRRDLAFHELLREAATEEAMIDAQYVTASHSYWQRGVFGYIDSRALRFPLTWALLFDMGVNFGVNHGFLRLAERELGVPSRSNPLETGLGEEQLITYVAQLRKRSHDRQAEATNFFGLTHRGNFWMSLITSGDWYLQGDENHLIVSNGRTINVLAP